MPITTKYILTASMDIAPEKEALFNEGYDREHIPYLLKVPGVISATRMTTEPVAGQVAEGEPKYMAVYELEDAGVPASQAWQDAVATGRWLGEVRPHVRNRRFVLRKVLNPKS